MIAQLNLKRVFQEIECRFENKRKSLDMLSPGKQAVIVSVPKHSLLAPLGLRKGKKVVFKGKQPWGGPIVVAIDHRNVAIARKLAQEITIAGEENAG